MPLGVAIGGGFIAAGGSVIAGSKAAKAQKNAAQTAADTTLATANANNALYRDIYGQNKALLTPYSDNGLLASNALTDLLLGPHGSGGTASALAEPDFRSGLPARADWASGALSAIGTPSGADPVTGLQGALSHLNPGQQRSWANYLDSNPDPDTVYEQRQADYRQSHPQTVASTTAPGGSALDAFDRFREGTNYQWRLGEGEKLLDSQYAARGAFDSGAERKALLKYGQNVASGELSNYMNLLASQQAMGLSAAGAVAGVGTSYAGNVAAQNTNASNVAANAALSSGQANANMWGTIGSTAGQIGGALFQYGMGQAMPSYSFNPVMSAASQPINVTPNGTTNWFNGRGGF